jgi:hypothetical protein
MRYPKMEEIDIRKKLISRLASSNIAKRGRIVEELGLCQGLGRIDVAIINGHFIGYEIKSEKDTLKRLNSQIPTYQKIFDKVTLVTTVRHYKEAEVQIPSNWGIMLAVETKNSIKLNTVRPATCNDKYDPSSIVKLLWKDESKDLLKQFGVTSGLSKLDRDSLWMKVLEVVPHCDLKQCVSNAILTREYWRPDQLQK